MSIKQKKGISLIVLVITIVVMIILAAVIILSLSGSGILSNARQARDKSNESNLKDAAIVAYSEWRTAYHLGKTDKTAEEYMADVLKKAGYTSKEIGKVTIGDGVIKILEIAIPEGFTKSIYDGEKTVEDGLVIYKTDAATLATKTQYEAQREFDQFVWVPVEYTDTNTDNDANGTDDGFDAVFKTTAWSNNAPTTLSTYYTEPSKYNGSTDYQYPTEVEEYEAMRKSVAEYGGFYIARYEAGDSSVTAKRTRSSKTGTVISRKGAYVYNWVAWGRSITNAYGNTDFARIWSSILIKKYV